MPALMLQRARLGCPIRRQPVEPTPYSLTVKADGGTRVDALKRAAARCTQPERCSTEGSCAAPERDRRSSDDAPPRQLGPFTRRMAGLVRMGLSFGVMAASSAVSVGGRNVRATPAGRGSPPRSDQKCLI
jgi:hypothetical protein